MASPLAAPVVAVASLVSAASVVAAAVVSASVVSASVTSAATVSAVSSADPEHPLKATMPNANPAIILENFLPMISILLIIPVGYRARRDNPIAVPLRTRMRPRLWKNQRKNRRMENLVFSQGRSCKL
ncbi:hypothetical protein, partial [Arthrobacter sp. H41]|uniref:hypothetical protein n=1 Tax=Arthrobacter sp. H41 TaxID=1312978 RepID=UPI001C1E88EF